LLDETTNPKNDMTEEQEKQISKLEEENSIYGVTCECFSSVLKEEGFSRAEVEEYYADDPEFIEMAKLDRVFDGE